MEREEEVEEDEEEERENNCVAAHRASYAIINVRPVDTMYASARSAPLSNSTKPQ